MKRLILCLLAGCFSGPDQLPDSSAMQDMTVDGSPETIACGDTRCELGKICVGAPNGDGGYRYQCCDSIVDIDGGVQVSCP